MKELNLIEVEEVSGGVIPLFGLLLAVAVGAGQLRIAADGFFEGYYEKDLKK
jgi:lactobin A/cerein 7B family class IIb bacteriocin